MSPAVKPGPARGSFYRVLAPPQSMLWREEMAREMWILGEARRGGGDEGKEKKRDDGGEGVV